MNISKAMMLQSDQTIYLSPHEHPSFSDFQARPDLQTLRLLRQLRSETVFTLPEQQKTIPAPSPEIDGTVRGTQHSSGLCAVVSVAKTLRISRPVRIFRHRCEAVGVQRKLTSAHPGELLKIKVQVQCSSKLSPPLLDA